MHSIEQFEAPDWINWPGLTFWTLKLATLIIAYVLITVNLVRRV